ncbi:zinc finger protein 184-like [Branchiostoma floridae]|uniref:Zinc finger protein 184-like n=1 Tax=Branchiostoma floridae TaxID=7739 RepID=A0A9J7KGQ8_BRAFL|nr:zinc finger protein 184-like [Branchiostoma floridae]
MLRQQEFICGLSHEVTIAVLPRLNMEELMFELNRRIQNLDKENSIKDRLVSILRDVMLEEYRQLERVSEVSSPDDTTIPIQDQETATMQENVLTAYTETMLSETSNSDTSQQSSGLDIVIKKERDASSDLLVPQFDTEQAQQDQLCDIPSPLTGSPSIPSCQTPLTQMNTIIDSCVKEEDVAMPTEDETATAYHDEPDIHTPVSNTQVPDILNPVNTSSTEKPMESDTPMAFCQLLPDHSDVHIKMECHMSQDDQNGQISQPSNPDQTEHYTDDRDTGIINSGHEKRQTRKDSSEETPLAPCQPTPDQDCENMECLHPDNGSQIDSKRNMCELKTSFVNSSSKHRKRQKGEKPFMCGECGYRAPYKSWLVAHMRTHTGEKPFKCNHCNYKASSKKYLVQHMKRHTDAEPYSCELCDYQTYRKSDIERHMMCHSGVKPYKCEECDYKTCQKTNLTRHGRLHFGQRPNS